MQVSPRSPAGTSDRTRPRQTARGVILGTVLAGAALLSAGAGSAPANAAAPLSHRDGAISGLTATTSPADSNRPRTKIVKVRLRQEGVHVYVRVYYSGPVSGFGFTGIKGSGWAPESHRISSPSYGRVGKGWVEYPFNHLCGKPGQYESDILFWLANRYQNPAAQVRVHLRCAHSKPREDKGKSDRPKTTIDKVTLRRDGVLVYVRVYFSGPVPGFGFKGINGSRWAEENHNIDSPSYGKFGPGWVEYPFNHLCGQPGQFESDIEFWLDNPYQTRQAKTSVHLSCGTTPPRQDRPQPGPSSSPREQLPGDKTPPGPGDPPWFTLGPGPR